MAGQIVNQPQTDTPGTPVVVLNVNTTSQATTGTSEEVLATYTLPANTLARNGQAVRVTMRGYHAANSNSATLRVRLGGIGGTVLAAHTLAAANGVFEINSVFYRTGATTGYMFSGTPAQNFGGIAPTWANAIDLDRKSTRLNSSHRL